jgi:hypothetical protein
VRFFVRLRRCTKRLQLSDGVIGLSLRSCEDIGGSIYTLLSYWDAKCPVHGAIHVIYVIALLFDKDLDKDADDDPTGMIYLFFTISHRKKGWPQFIPSMSIELKRFQRILKGRVALACPGSKNGFFFPDVMVYLFNSYYGMLNHGSTVFRLPFNIVLKIDTKHNETCALRLANSLNGVYSSRIIDSISCGTAVTSWPLGSRITDFVTSGTI